MKGNAAVIAIAFSRDGHMLAAGYADNTMRLWDTAASSRSAIPCVRPPWRYTAAFSPDGRTLASGSDDGTIRLWDTSDQTLSAVLKGHEQGGDQTWTSVPTEPVAVNQPGSHSAALAGADLPGCRPNALCAKLTHNMSPEQWNTWSRRRSPIRRFATACLRGSRPRTAATPIARELTSPNPDPWDTCRRDTRRSDCPLVVLAVHQLLEVRHCA